jgi:hypothetical protein
LGVVGRVANDNGVCSGWISHLLQCRGKNIWMWLRLCHIFRRGLPCQQILNAGELFVYLYLIPLCRRGQCDVLPLLFDALEQLPRVRESCDAR